MFPAFNHLMIELESILVFQTYLNPLNLLVMRMFIENPVEQRLVKVIINKILRSDVEMRFWDTDFRICLRRDLIALWLSCWGFRRRGADALEATAQRKELPKFSGNDKKKIVCLQPYHQFSSLAQEITTVHKKGRKCAKSQDCDPWASLIRGVNNNNVMHRGVGCIANDGVKLCTETHVTKCGERNNDDQNRGLHSDLQSL